jgi:hypothetical protein
MELFNLLRMNLTFFSAAGAGAGSGAGEGGEGNQDPNNDNPGGEGNTNTNTGGTGEPGNTPPEDKTFTQEDVNNIAAREAKKAQEKLFKELGIEDFESAKEGMSKFQEWQESQKTEAEKQADKLNKLEKSHADTQAENANLKAQLSAVKAGVNPESVEDVVALAERQVTEEVSIDEAIKQVIKKYPHFAAAAEEKKDDEGNPYFSTGKHVSKSTNKDDPFAAHLARIRNRK